MFVEDRHAPLDRRGGGVEGSPGTCGLRLHFGPLTGGRADSWSGSICRQRTLDFTSATILIGTHNNPPRAPGPPLRVPDTTLGNHRRPVCVCVTCRCHREGRQCGLLCPVEARHRLPPPHPTPRMSRVGCGWTRIQRTPEGTERGGRRHRFIVLSLDTM